MLIYHLVVMWFTVVFFISGLYINVLQLLVLPFYWINRDFYRVIILKLCYCLFSEITFFAEWWGDMNIIVYSTKKDLEIVKKEKSIIVINHYSDVDWLAAWILGERIGIVQSAKVLLKDMVKYIPTLGWCWWFAEYAFVKRRWDKDQSSLMKNMSSLKEHKSHFSLTLFCEGTRRTEAKLKASQDYALQNNIKPLKHHLLPRTKGFAFTVRELRQTVNVLCNLQLAFSDVDKCNIGSLINRGRIDVHLYLRCLPMSSVPSLCMEESAAYCKRIYQEKDELLEYFHHHGKFPGPCIHLPRKYTNLFTFICHNTIVGCLLVKMLHFCLHVLTATSMISLMVLFGISDIMIFKRLVFTWFVIVFLISSLVINLMQFGVLPLYWLHKRSYYKLISKLCYCLFAEITLLGEWWSEIDLKVYGNAEDIESMKKENWVSVANHFSDIDWLVAWIISERLGILGDTMCFMKDSSKYIPIVGWAFWFSDWGFLKRDWKKDEKEILKTANMLKNDKHHYCMMLYCEGTRRTPAKLKSSQEYAIQNDIEPLKHHLLPRTKGFAVTVQELKNHTPAIYDVEMAFSNPEKATISNLINQTKVEVHAHIRRIPMSTVSCKSKEDYSGYCMELYRSKDNLMDHFSNNGSFPGTQQNVSRGYSNLVTFVLYNVLVGWLFYLVSCWICSVNGPYLLFTFYLIIGITGYVVLEILNRVTQTNKGSTFGLRSNPEKMKKR